MISRTKSNIPKLRKITKIKPLYPSNVLPSLKTTQTHSPVRKHHHRINAIQYYVVTWACIQQSSCNTLPGIFQAYTLHSLLATFLYICIQAASAWEAPIRGHTTHTTAPHVITIKLFISYIMSLHLFTRRPIFEIYYQYSFYFLISQFVGE